MFGIDGYEFDGATDMYTVCGVDMTETGAAWFACQVGMCVDRRVDMCVDVRVGMCVHQKVSCTHFCITPHSHNAVLHNARCHDLMFTMPHYHGCTAPYKMWHHR